MIALYDLYTRVRLSHQNIIDLCSLIISINGFLNKFISCIMYFNSRKIILQIFVEWPLPILNGGELQDYFS